MKTEYVTTITSEDVKILEKLINAKNKGLGVNATEVCDLYDRIMGKTCRRTNCSGCLKGYIQQMEARYNQWKKTLELAPQSPVEPSKEEVVDDTPQEENKPKTKGVSKKTK